MPSKARIVLQAAGETQRVIRTIKKNSAVCYHVGSRKPAAAIVNIASSSTDCKRPSLLLLRSRQPRVSH